ncbi:MAG TPA: hypothetical protein PK495_07530 [Bacteroidales bacterium]|nr:hypothetical protein [Bacteroidales bacterium]HQB20412.1 hypothetical protein [Bacteroidales bacterium]
MSIEDKKEVLKTYSVRLSKQNKEALAELYESGDFRTQNQMFETLIENYFTPRLVNKENLKKIEELETALKGKEEEIADLEANKTSLENITLSMTSQLEDKEKEFLKKAEVYAQEYLEMKLKEMNDKFIIPIELGELNYKLLSYVAEREGSKRKQNWKIGDVINYFIHTRFEKGLLNGDLESVPDNIVKAIKKEL